MDDRYRRRRGLYEEQQRGQGGQTGEGLAELQDAQRGMGAARARVEQLDQQLAEMEEQQALLDQQSALIEAELELQLAAMQEQSTGLPAQGPAQPIGPGVPPAGGVAPPMREYDRLRAEGKWLPGSQEVQDYINRMEQRDPQTGQRRRRLM